ncbi:ATP-binding protein [Streptomyces sp. NPDC002643]
MKQSAAKTLGVAALGAAIAAAGAGAANAAPSAPAPDASQALGTVTQSLPVEKVSQALPSATGAVTQGQRALGAGLEAAQPATASVLAEGPTSPVGKLLGGLPVGQTALPTTQGLGTNGLGVNGLPLGGGAGA